MKQIRIYTDGACSGNPGRGGWGAVLLYKERRKELSGGEMETTNNRMELTAAIEALAALKESCSVTLFTDSQYLRQGVTEWIHQWRKRGWVTREKTPVKNKDLWCRLDKSIRHHQVTWNWLKGHAGDQENERCDQLARNAISRLKKAEKKG